MPLHSPVENGADLCVPRRLVLRRYRCSGEPRTRPLTSGESRRVIREHASEKRAGRELPVALAAIVEASREADEAVFLARLLAELTAVAGVELGVLRLVEDGRLVSRAAQGCDEPAGTAFPRGEIAEAPFLAGPGAHSDATRELELLGVPLYEASELVGVA